MRLTKETMLNFIKECMPLETEEELRKMTLDELAGHSDWHLPNIKELQSLIDYGRCKPAIDPVFTAESSWYWYSSSLVFLTNVAWFVYFDYGGVYNDNKYHDNYVRAVRG